MKTRTIAVQVSEETHTLFRELRASVGVTGPQLITLALQTLAAAAQQSALKNHTAPAPAIDEKRNAIDQSFLKLSKPPKLLHEVGDLDTLNTVLPPDAPNQAPPFISAFQVIAPVVPDDPPDIFGDREPSTLKLPVSDDEFEALMASVL